MTKLFCQVDALFGTNDKLEAVGREGFLVLLGLDAQLRLEPNSGVLSASRASPRRLRLTLAAFHFSTEEIETALAALEAEGLIERRDDGTIYLPKWQEWGHDGRPMTGAERVAKHRAAKKAAQDVTPGNACNAGNECNAEQEQEQSKRRAEKTPAGAPPPAPASAVENPASAPAEGELRAEAVRLAARLRDASWGNSEDQRRQKAGELAAAGMTEADMERLWRHAHKRGTKDPRRLFAHLIKRPENWGPRVNDTGKPPPGEREGGMRRGGQVLDGLVQRIGRKAAAQ